MLIFHNISKSWLSEEPFEETEDAGVLTDVLPTPPPGLDDPNANEILMRYDLVLIDADHLNEDTPESLESKKMFWDGHEWQIDGAVTWHHNDELRYRFWISKGREGEPPR